MEAALDDRLRRTRRSMPCKGGYNIIILSDRAIGPDQRCRSRRCSRRAAVHHHLIRKGLRTHGRPRASRPARRARCTTSALLAGYGAEAINPYLAFETLEDMVQHARGRKLAAYEVVKRYIKAIGKGILKVMSKMGISTYQSYCGAQIFDAVGLSTTSSANIFTGTATHDRGRRPCRDRARKPSRRHERGVRRLDPVFAAALDVGGDYAYAHARRGACLDRRDRSSHLQHAVRGNAAGQVSRPTPEPVNEQSEQLLTIRGLFRIQAPTRWAEPVRLDEVEPAGDDRQALRDRCDVASARSRREAHDDARHRDEPHRRQVQHRRRRRGSRSLRAAGQWRFRCARRSSRWRPAASA